MAAYCLEKRVPFSNSHNAATLALLPFCPIWRVFPTIGKVELAQHSPLEFAPKSSLYHPERAALRSEDLCSDGGYFQDKPPSSMTICRQRLHRGLRDRYQPCPSNPHFSFRLNLPPTSLRSSLYLPAQRFFGTASESAGAGWGGHHSVPAASTASSCEAVA